MQPKVLSACKDTPHYRISTILQHLSGIHTSTESVPFFNTYLAYTPVQNQCHSSIPIYPPIPIWHTHQYRISAIFQYLSGTHQYRIRTSARIIVNDCLLRWNPHSHLLISVHTTKESVPSVSTYLLVQLPSRLTSKESPKSSQSFKQHS